jgi:hypothetical protein
MSAETKKVLEMLAAGKISTEDAERLLDKISGATAATRATGSQSSATVTSTGGAATPSTPSAANAKRPRYLRIQVERPGREGTSIRVPIPFVRNGRHWMAILPERVSDKLREHGIDFCSLEAMSDEDFQRTLGQMNVDVESDGGKRVRIYCE